MRTTVTLDDDVASRLRRLRAARGGQKKLINDLLRMGLDRMEQRPTPDGPSFHTETYRLGARRAWTTSPRSWRRARRRIGADVTRRKSVVVRVAGGFPAA